jgi:hypothetical protein
MRIGLTIFASSCPVGRYAPGNDWLCGRSANGYNGNGSGHGDAVQGPPSQRIGRLA